jgi:hypothetical protein
MPGSRSGLAPCAVLNALFTDLVIGSARLAASYERTSARAGLPRGFGRSAPSTGPPASRGRSLPVRTGGSGRVIGMDWARDRGLLLRLVDVRESSRQP